eukprot:CAMPEP_0179428652 /NCGR_PEP_ID=MMETSP0799-20121207/14263_1 /TAXON_ID=46947 /ORGANISM="Geminigera cryophila, Strain CCMP2564" /LENGTH=208 /DNA_ID=CAMNT_0021204239 /DNA_START=248 /DNA_END=873 /DNA_ORIENTATION=+
MKKRGVEWQASLWEQWDADGKNVDAMMIKNDIAVLSINTLGQAVIELISKGPKQTPGMTLSDWIIVSRYFSVAASISIAWVLVGLTVNHFQGGIEELLRDPVDRARAAFGGVANLSAASASADMDGWCAHVFASRCVAHDHQSGDDISMALFRAEFLSLDFRRRQLQCVAVCCSVLQCVAVCRSVLQRAACCNVFPFLQRSVGRNVYR